jgi:DNA-binding cell septation regulator SpoVG
VTTSSQTIQITGIKIRFVDKGTSGLVAWVSCVISGGIKLDNIAIRRSGRSELYLSYPAKRTASGGTHHYFFPISKDASQAIENAILSQLAKLAQPIHPLNGPEAT